MIRCRYFKTHQLINVRRMCRKFPPSTLMKSPSRQALQVNWNCRLLLVLRKLLIASKPVVCLKTPQGHYRQTHIAMFSLEPERCAVLSKNLWPSKKVKSFTGAFKFRLLKVNLSLSLNLGNKWTCLLRPGNGQRKSIMQANRGIVGEMQSLN